MLIYYFSLLKLLYCPQNNLTTFQSAARGAVRLWKSSRDHDFATKIDSRKYTIYILFSENGSIRIRVVLYS